MSQATVAPSQVNIGDKVVINKQIYFVNSMQGPDSRGVYDAYLLRNDNGQPVHAIVVEPITIISD